MTTYTGLSSFSSRSLGFSLKEYSAPAIEPITVTEAKAYLRVVVADDDALIGAQITAARQKVEADTRLSLITRTMDQTIDRFPCGAEPLHIFAAPLLTVTSVTSYASDDTSSTFASSNYFLDLSRIPGRICLKQSCTWPTGLRSRVAGVVRFTAGYGPAATDCPSALLVAMRLLIGHWYKTHGADNGPLADDFQRVYDALINPFVVHYVGDEA